jgi:hypothetical protein
MTMYYVGVSKPNPNYSKFSQARPRISKGIKEKGLDFFEDIILATSSIISPFLCPD